MVWIALYSINIFLFYNTVLFWSDSWFTIFDLCIQWCKIILNRFYLSDRWVFFYTTCVHTYLFTYTLCGTTKRENKVNKTLQICSRSSSKVKWKNERIHVFSWSEGWKRLLNARPADSLFSTDLAHALALNRSTDTFGVSLCVYDTLMRKLSHMLHTSIINTQQYFPVWLYNSKLSVKEKNC